MRQTVAVAGSCGLLAAAQSFSSSSSAFLAQPGTKTAPQNLASAPIVEEPLAQASYSSAGSARTSTAAVSVAAALTVGGLAAAPRLLSKKGKKRAQRQSKIVRLAEEEKRYLRPRDRIDGHGWIKEDPQFNSMDESLVVETHTIELKKRPSGITRYTHCEGKGAMVMELKPSRYPGDPQGQATAAGVKAKMVIKTINGEDVRDMDFEKIMDMLEDYIPDPDLATTAAFGQGSADRAKLAEQVEFPVTIEYLELKDEAFAEKKVQMKVPEGAWMPRMSTWTDEDLAKERERAKGFEEPGADYTGPRYTGPADIDEAWLAKLQEGFLTGTVLPKKDAYMMLLDWVDVLRDPAKTSTVVDVKVAPGQELTIFGDIHGQYFDFVNMMKSAGVPSADRPFIFNGDFVDRGSWSIEVLLSLIALKLRTPDSVFFNRGNHEMLETNIIYGFAGECGSKYDMGFFDLCSEAFRHLPLVHMVNDEVMVVHAGIPGPRPRVWAPGQTHDPEDAIPVNKEQVKIAEIREVDRVMELTDSVFKRSADDDPLGINGGPPKVEETWETNERIMVDCLWADPRGGPGYGPSYRKSKGVFMFGPDVIDSFCKANDLNLVIRSHEVKTKGFQWEKKADAASHTEMISVFSAPNYLDTGGNKGAYLKCTNESGKIQVEPVIFDPVEHPDIPCMYYQDFIIQNHSHLTRQMKKRVVESGDEFGDSDFAGNQGPDEWIEVDDDEN
eukprot:TRINITY_DN3113_c0_g2_i1.p1 TRINITY_DN3113_c0_g2~~TRINITY_DN3113_c0_g2_i1.p1  ORF type:complete len:725 (-),score=230.31 TRINITY_DN3113_c0_g2_i1:137-2311(-)